MLDGETRKEECIADPNLTGRKEITTFFYLYALLTICSLIIDCGVDDFLIESNRELHRRLVYNKTPHEYLERPGAHTWPYWGYALEYHLLFFQKVKQGNSPIPATAAKNN